MGPTSWGHIASVPRMEPSAQTDNEVLKIVVGEVEFRVSGILLNGMSRVHVHS